MASSSLAEKHQPYVFLPSATSNKLLSTNLSQTAVDAIWNFLDFAGEKPKAESQASGSMGTSSTTRGNSFLLRHNSLPLSAAVYFGQLTSTPSDRLFKEPVRGQLQYGAFDGYCSEVNESKTLILRSPPIQTWANCALIEPTVKSVWVKSFVISVNMLCFPTVATSG